MFKQRKRILAFVMSMVMILCFGTAQAFALTPGVDSDVSGSVIMSGNEDTFANNMPFAKYRVMPSYLRVGGDYQGEFKTYGNYDSNISLMTHYNSATTLSAYGPSVVYTGIIGPGKTVTLNGDVFDITFKNAAIDILGGRHDVTLTVSDIALKNASSKTGERVTLVTNAIWAIGLMFDDDTLSMGLSNDEVKKHVISQCGISMTITMTIQNPTVDGGVNISFNDIDAVDKTVTPQSYDGNYSERVEIGYDSIMSKVYMTSANDGNLLRVSKGSEGLLFRSTQTDDTTFYSGFAVQVKPTNTIKWAGGSCATLLYNGAGTIGIRPMTKLYDNTNSKVSDSWTISSAGGNISMTESFDDSSINYADEKDFYGNKYVVRFFTRNKPTVFSVGAKEGYKLSDVNMNSTQDVGPSTGSVLTKFSNNKMSYTLPTGNGNYYVNAFYEPITKSVKVHKEDKAGNPMKDVTFTVSGKSSVHGSFSISGTTDASGEVELKGIPYGTADDEYKLTESDVEGYVPVTPNPTVFKFSDLGDSAGPDFTFVNEKVHAVTYEITPDPDWGEPDDSVAPVDDNKYKTGDDVELESALNSTQNYAVDPTTSKQIKGTWTFEGWAEDEDVSSTVIKEIEGIAKDETVYGKWTFEPDPLHVTYVVDPDPDWGEPSRVDVPTDDTDYPYKGDVTVAEDLTTTQDYAVDPKTGDKVPGTWEFVTWDKDDFEITEDTTITGGWKFTPTKYEVTYVVDPDPEWGEPSGATVPTDDSEYDYKDSVTVAEDLTTTQDYAVDPNTGDQIPGTWEFVTWDKDDFEITEDTTITGEWKFTPTKYEVTYVVDPDPSWGTPAGGDAPVDGNSPYDYKDSVTVAEDLTTTQGYAVDPKTGDKVPGTWTFTPWDKDDFEITEDTTITGGWSFTPKTYKVKYVVNGDKTYGLPDDSATPVDAGVYNYKDPVSVAESLTSDCNYAIVDGKKVRGTWKFVVWDKEDFLITEDTVITGAWEFIPDEEPADSNNSDPEEPDKKDEPDTGDSNEVGLWVTIFALSGAALCGASVYRRRKSNNTH